jgi:hypothetical protein
MKRALYACCVALLSLTCAPQQSASQPTEPSSEAGAQGQGKKIREVSLVTPKQLARHNLPSTQRTPIHVGLSTKILSYYTPDTGPHLFLGVGGPMLSYSRLRWRTATLWVNSDLGFQIESALGLNVYQFPQGVLQGVEVVLGFHLGAQKLPNFYDDEDTWSDSYTSLSDNYAGLQLALYGDHLWVELSYDMSDITHDDWYNDIYDTQTKISTFGLNFGFAL